MEKEIKIIVANEKGETISTTASTPIQKKKLPSGEWEKYLSKIEELKFKQK